MFKEPAPLSAPQPATLPSDFPGVSPVARLVCQLVRFRVLAATLGILVLAVAIPLSQQLELDRNITAMFSTADQTRVDYEELQEAFGGNAIAILVYNDDLLFSAKGLGRNQQIAQQVGKINGVRKGGILSPAQLSQAIQSMRPALLSGFPIGVPGLLRKGDNVAERLDQLFAGYTHSADHSRAAVVAILESNYPDSTIDDLKLLAQRLPTDHKDVKSAAVVGEPILVNDAFDLIERDGTKLATLTIVLLSIVVLVSLVDYRFVLLTGVIIFWSICVSQAAMVLLEIRLSLISTIMTSIVTVIAVATVLHLGIRYRVFLSRKYGQLRAVVFSLSAVFMPIVWTCATDAAGFAALGVSRILPVQVFGMSIAIAASCVVIATVLFGPLLMLLPELYLGAAIRKRQQGFARWLRRCCMRLASWSIKHRSALMIGSVITAVVVVFGVVQTQVETSFLNNFRANDPIVVTYDEIEKNFGGAGVWDIILDAPDVISDQYIDEVDQLQQSLRELDIDGTQLTKVLSLADVDRAISLVPLAKVTSPTVRITGMQTTLPVFVEALLTAPDSVNNIPRRFRVALRSREHLDAKRKTQLIQAVEDLVAKHTSRPEWKAVCGTSVPGRVTGYYVMMARLISQLIDDQWRCFVASGVLVWLLLLMATRSLRLATAALVPNLLPVLFTLAVVGFLGGKINMGATMIAAVSIGLSIDGSVHFMSSYRRRKARGHQAARSAIHAAGSIGVPVLLATLALVFGFSVLTTSEFIPTATFGTLVAATLAAGTLINLTLLPACVSWIDR